MATNLFDNLLEEETELLTLWMAACSIEDVAAPGPERNPSIFEQRMMWHDYCELHLSRGTFDRRLRMSKPSFDKLLSYMRDHLLINETQARKRGGGIVPELCLYCTIRWLAGGSYLDICDVAGISKASFYQVVWRTITAIVLCPELEIVWPTTDEQIRKGIEGFSSISTESMKNLKWMAQVIARLHNYVIDERLAMEEDPMLEIREHSGEDGPSYYHPTVPEDENDNPIALDRLFEGTIQGHSHFREAMADRVERLQLERPYSNRIRKEK